MTELDHDAARELAAEWSRAPVDPEGLRVISHRNLARCYLDSLAECQALRELAATATSKMVMEVGRLVGLVERILSETPSVRSKAVREARTLLLDSESEGT